MTKTGILLIHFNNSPHTLACLDSLHHIVSQTTFRVYILSSQSLPDSKLKKHPVNPTIIDTEKNLGFAGANNLLIKHAIKDGCDAVVLLNNDTTVDKNFLDPLLTQLNDPTVGMVSSKIYFYPGNEYQPSYSQKERGRVIWYAGGVIDWSNVHGFHWGVDEVDHGQFNQPQKTAFTTGCSLAVSKTTIAKIGLMDESYFLYYEDTDWSMRAKKAGLKIIMEPKSIVWHKNAGSTGGPGSSLHTRYQKRNRLKFGLTYAPLRTKAHLLIQWLNSLVR